MGKRVREGSVRTIYVFMLLVEMLIPALVGASVAMLVREPSPPLFVLFLAVAAVVVAATFGIVRRTTREAEDYLDGDQQSAKQAHVTECQRQVQLDLGELRAEIVDLRAEVADVRRPWWRRWRDAR